MNDLRTAAQQALEFIRAMNKHGWLLADYESDMERTVARLEAALAQEQAEPVAYRHLHEDGWEYSDAPTGEDCAECQALYTAPPKLVPLTGEELKQIEMRLRIYFDNDRYDLSLHDFARAVERAHGIGGQDGR